jgi:transposase
LQSQLASRVTAKIKRKEEARKSLTNCFTSDHCYLIARLMDQYDHLDSQIKSVEDELAEKMRPYAHLVEKLKEIPGVNDILAMGIISEATTDMSSFKDGRSFAAWAGVASGNNESAGKKKDQKPEKATLT